MEGFVDGTGVELAASVALGVVAILLKSDCVVLIIVLVTRCYSGRWS